MNDWDEKLIVYAEENNLDGVTKALENGARIFFRNYFALRIACKNGNLDVLKIFENNGFNFSSDENCAMTTASKFGQIKIVEFLISKGISVSCENEAPIRYACENGYLDVAKYLISKGANVYYDENYAFRMAATNNHLEMVIYLVEQQRADILASNCEAFAYASEYKCIDVLGYLLKKIAEKHKDKINIIMNIIEPEHQYILKKILLEGKQIKRESDFEDNFSL